MVNSYTPATHYSNTYNEFLRRLQNNGRQFPSQSVNPQFGGGTAKTEPDSFTSRNQNPNPSAAPKKTGFFKKLLIGAGVIGGLYFFGKKATALIGGKVAENLIAQLAKSLPAEGISKNVGQAFSAENLKALTELLKKAGIKPENITSFLSTQAGKTVLNAAKSERGINTIKNLILGVAGKYLPEPAVQLLEKQATAKNIEKLLDAGVLASVVKYGGELYRQSSGHFRSYLQANAEPIAEQLAKLTGFEKTQIEKYLKAFQV